MSEGILYLYVQTVDGRSVPMTGSLRQDFIDFQICVGNQVPVFLFLVGKDGYPSNFGLWDEIGDAELGLFCPHFVLGDIYFDQYGNCNQLSGSRHNDNLPAVNTQTLWITPNFI
jgi:hypothetical protein